MKSIRLRAAFAVAALPLLAAACSGGGDSSSSSAGSNGQVTIAMGDFYFEPSALEVTAGETVRFLVTNEGAVEHEFRVTNEALIAEHLEEDHGEEDHEEGEGEEAEEGYFIVLEPGESGVLEVTFPTGTTVFTEIACLLPGHYEAGMKGPIDYRT